MGSITITGRGGVAISDKAVQISLPDTDVVFKYDADAHTITLDGAHAALGDEPLPLRQAKGLKQELVLLHPNWPGLKT